MRVVVIDMLVGKAPSCEDNRVKLIDSVSCNLRYSSNLFPFIINVEEQNVAYIWRSPIHFAPNVQSQVAPWLGRKSYALYMRCLASMATISRNNGGAIHHEFGDVLVDSKPTDALRASLLYLYDAPVAFVREGQHTLAQGDWYHPSYLAMNETV